MTGNWFAVFAILAWPFVSFALYRNRTAAEATIWTILGGLLLLPSGTGLKIEMIPAIDKNSVPNLCALVGCIFFANRRRSVKFTFGLTEILLLTLLFGRIVTGTLNDDAIATGDIILPGVGYYDGISALLSQALIIIPFLLGRRVLQESSGTELVIRSLFIAGLFYSLPMLLEIRFSPQLSNWIYGFFQSSFVTEIRYGGFRPVVFMQNGLAAAFFMMTTFLAAVAMWRLNVAVRPLPPAGVSAYLGLLVVLCKSAGTLIYAVVAGAFIRWLSPSVQLRLAVVLAAIALLYPVLRTTDMFPDKFLVETAASINRERADSLQVRFQQEKRLLDHAWERLAFGWGRYGRNRVYEESGQDTTITDGWWIITLGQFGLVGFLAEFGLLAMPVFRAASACKRIASERDRVFFSAIALIVGLGIFEQIPNASVSPWSWLLAGALLGRTEHILARSRRKVNGSQAGLNSGRELTST